MITIKGETVKIIAVDNEKLALETLGRTIRSVVPDAEVKCCGSSDEAIVQAGEMIPDVAFLDIEMPGLNGIELAKELKSKVNPRINIIFTTGYSEYIETAFMDLRSSGYLLKPITSSKVREELENLRNPVEVKGGNRVRVKAFGTFEIYVDEKPVSFHYAKTNELVAYLIDRRTMCTNGELQEVLWEGDEKSSNHSSYLQNLMSDLNKTLSKYKCRDILLRRYGAVGIDTAKVDCDYYEYLNGNPAVVNAFRGEYMTQYSWGERTLASLMMRRD